MFAANPSHIATQTVAPTCNLFKSTYYVGAAIFAAN